MTTVSMLYNFSIATLNFIRVLCKYLCRRAGPSGVGKYHVSPVGGRRTHGIDMGSANE